MKRYARSRAAFEGRGQRPLPSLGLPTLFLLHPVKLRVRRKQGHVELSFQICSLDDSLEASLAEPVSAIRDCLEQINALVDFLPGQSSAGGDPAVVSHVLHHGDGAGQLADAPESNRLFGDHHELSGDFEPVFEWGPEVEQKMAALGASSRETIRSSVMVDGGTDALGFYSSFHVRGAQWGATVRLSGIAWMVAEVFKDLRADIETKSRLAFHAILQHELFHFATDMAISQVEISQQAAWWWPAKQSRIEQGAGYLQDEEKFANAWMLSAFRTALPRFRVSGKQDALKKFVDLQPDGYRHALEVKTIADWAKGLHDLALCYAYDSGQVSVNELFWGRGYDWSALFQIRPRIDWRNCAIHLVDDSARFGVPPGWLVFFSSLSEIEETRSFSAKLSKLGPQIQSAWTRLRLRAQQGLTSGHGFKRWPKGGADAWSIRVNDNFRAHLRHDRATGTWIAVDIGDHKSMGHG